jgi:SAM-dependent methyltransferase
MKTSEERGGLPPDQYHESQKEQTRIANLMAHLPVGVDSVLDIGARYGYITRKLAERAGSVTALDLEMPLVDDPRVRCVQGDATALAFADSSFDLVFCAEVLEHIPSPDLERACREMARVSRRWVLIGVPYKQDIRLWRTTCQACGGRCPPWAHVNRFDEQRLAELFVNLQVERQSLVGTAEPDTNAVSAWLMDIAGNPFGTYVQDEACVHCGSQLVAPTTCSLSHRLLAKVALALRRVVNLGQPGHANWIHLLLRKDS